ncbi:MAG TPA: hypothetical protein VFD47_00630, partial [Actinomycetota bacterium]|nr:hypothetical protein [Actinomycetota bacterium]
MNPRLGPHIVEILDRVQPVLDGTDELLGELGDGLSRKRRKRVARVHRPVPAVLRRRRLARHFGIVLVASSEQDVEAGRDLTERGELFEQGRGHGLDLLALCRVVLHSRDPVVQGRDVLQRFAPTLGRVADELLRDAEVDVHTLA